MAANVDTAFIVGSLNSELNPNRVERFLVAAYDGGVSPVVLLNKTDLCPEPGAMQSGMEARLPGVPVHAISAATGEGMGELGRYLGGGRTAVFLGSSGVGKSTIINRLLGGDTIRTAEVSGYKDRGRHTTTSREMYLLQNGGIVIDTPGLRELQIWDGGEGISQAFRDIEELSGQCRFSDCRHMGEPGCAVQTAVEGGSISQERLRSYHKILREASFHRRRQNVRLRIEEAKRWKTISKSMRHFDKSRRFSS
jgi:ribosome biogenesis GTPase